LLAVETDEAVEVWDISAQTLHSTLFYTTLLKLTPNVLMWPNEEIVHRNFNISLGFSPDSEVLAIGSVLGICNEEKSCPARGVIYQWDVQTTTFLDLWVAENCFYNFGSPKQVQFTPDGKKLALVYNVNNAGCSRSHDCAVWWDAQSGDHLSTFSAGEITDIAFSPNSNLAAISYSKRVCPSDGLRLALMDTTLKDEIASTPPLPILFNHSTIRSPLAFNPNGQSFVVSIERHASNTDVYVFDSQTLQEHAIYGYDILISSIAFSLDGETLLVGDTHGVLYFLDAGSGKQLGAVDTRQGWVSDIVVSQDGKFLVTVGNGKAHLWRTSFQ
jgi:WD40 repeat protein